MKCETIGESNKIEVLKHYIRIEATKSKYEDNRKEIMSWVYLPDGDFIHKVRNFEKTRDDENPTIVWTIGTEKNPNRHQKVRRWILANINLGCLYTCGINPKMKCDLDSVNGNLRCFVNRKYAVRYKEFRTDCIPTNTEASVIGIARCKDNRNGEVEIVDGCHRVIAMLANGIESTEAYIAILS